MRRNKLEIAVEFYDAGDENSYEGPEPVKFAEVSALVSFSDITYDATRDPNSRINQPSHGDRSGSVRVFLGDPPAGLRERVEAGDEVWMLFPEDANRFFALKTADLRGVLPGRYPNRLTGEGK